MIYRWTRANNTIIDTLINSLEPTAHPLLSEESQLDSQLLNVNFKGKSLLLTILYSRRQIKYPKLHQTRLKTTTAGRHTILPS